MIFSATNPVDNLPKNANLHSSCKNPSVSPNGVETKPRLVFRITLPPSPNEGKNPCKVVKGREDEKPVPTFSSGTNGIEKKPPLVLRIKLPPAHNKEKKSCKAKNDEVDQKLVPTGTTKLASKVARKHKSDKRPVPTSSGGVNCAEMKACHVMRTKFPTPSNSGGQSDPKSAMGDKLVLLMPSSGMSGTDGDGNKDQTRVMQQTWSTNGGSALAKTADKICLGKLQMDEEALELKLEASKRKLHQRYQQAQNAKRKIELIDFKDIPKPENVAKRSKMQHRRR